MRGLVMLCVLAACSGKPTRPVDKVPSAMLDPGRPDAAPAGVAGPDPRKWQCAADGDCINSCSEGAVSAAWYRTAGVTDCMDGCANQISAPARCIDGGCVAFRRDPQHPETITRDDGCTHR